MRCDGGGTGRRKLARLHQSIVGCLEMMQTRLALIGSMTAPARTRTPR
jgi:hypothetical protein